MAKTPTAAVSAEYDRCVHCGLCLPYCPTFQLSGHEAESPRGRIALVKGLMEGELSATPTLARRLESCLHCGQCEAVCPSEAPFENIINAAKKFLAERRPALMHPVPWWLSYFSVSHAPQRILSWFVRSLQASGLLKALSFLRWPFRLRWLMPLAALPVESFAPPRPSSAAIKQSAGRPRVALFTGCLGRALDGNTLRAARCLLRSAGYAVHLPSAQTCCAALHEHAGDGATTRKLALKNRRAFSAFDEALSCASGCGASLLRHQKELGFRAREIHDFLLEHAGDLQFRPLAKRVYLHAPCSLRGGSRAAVGDLLACVPALEVKHVAATACCGAAGVNMLQNPETAAALAKPMVDELAAGEADLLLTANMGCALHLRQQLSRRGLRAPVMHPVELLARQLRC